MADINAIAESLGKLTVLEIAELVKKLETDWGVSAAAPVAAAAAPAAGGAAAAAPAEAKTEFDVILGAPFRPDKNIAVIKAVREIKTGLGRPRPRSSSRKSSEPVLEAANKADSDSAKKKLEEAGPRSKSSKVHAEDRDGPHVVPVFGPPGYSRAHLEPTASDCRPGRRDAVGAQQQSGKRRRPCSCFFVPYPGLNGRQQ